MSVVLKILTFSRNWMLVIFSRIKCSIINQSVNRRIYFLYTLLTMIQVKKSLKFQKVLPQTYSTYVRVEIMHI